MKWTLSALLFCLQAALASGLSILKLPSDDEIYSKVKAKLAGNPEKVERIVKRAGNRTIEFEAFISADGDIKTAPQILSNFPAYSTWALKNININPATGGKYFFQILNLVPEPSDKQVIKGSFLFNLPLFKQEIVRSFRMSFAKQSDTFTVTGIALPHEESPISAAEGMLRAFPAEKMPNHVWFYVRAMAILKNWILYEALPEKLLTRESGERMKIVVDNYIAEEDRLRSSRIPTEKKEALWRIKVSPLPQK